MNRFLHFVLLAAFGTVFQPSQAQDLGPSVADAPYLSLAESFFDNLAQSDAPAAMDALYAGSEAHVAKAQFDQIKVQLANLYEIFGDYVGHELFAQAEVNARFVSLEFFCMYEKSPVRMIMRFYRPHDAWFTHGFSFNADFDEIADQRAQLASAMKSSEEALSELESILERMEKLAAEQ